MKNFSTHNALTLKQFMKRREVLSLYKDILKTINKIENKEDKKYLLNWVRTDFKKNKFVSDAEVINSEITRGKLTLKELSSAISLSK